MTSIMTSPTRARRQQPSEWPREPQTVEETGLDFGLLLDLTLKSIYSAGRPSARLLGGRMGLSFAIVNELLQFLRKQECVEVVGSAGAGEFDATGDGDATSPSRVFEAMQRPADKRWCVARRPVVIAGGELTLADLELGYSPTGKFYIAPLQVKANNGVFVIDDFGRQRLSPAELLNR